MVFARITFLTCSATRTPIHIDIVKMIVQHRTFEPGNICRDTVLRGLCALLADYAIRGLIWFILMSFLMMFISPWSEWLQITKEDVISQVKIGAEAGYYIFTAPVCTVGVVFKLWVRNWVNVFVAAMTEKFEDDGHRRNSLAVSFSERQQSIAKSYRHGNLSAAKGK